MENFPKVDTGRVEGVDHPYIYTKGCTAKYLVIEYIKNVVYHESSIETR